MNKSFLILEIVIVASCLMVCIAHAESRINDDDAIKALIGEAIGQSDQELLAHAFAIRNRGHLKGVYGLNTWKKHNTPENWQKASKAWYTSELVEDITSGCNHWLSDYDLKHSRESLIAWRHKAVYSIKIGSTTFYKL